MRNGGKLSVQVQVLRRARRLMHSVKLPSRATVQWHLAELRQQATIKSFDCVAAAVRCTP